MNTEEIKTDLLKHVSGLELTVEGESFVVPKEKLLETARFLKENEKYRMDYLSCVTGVDYLAARQGQPGQVAVAGCSGGGLPPDLPALRDRRCGGQSELASDYLESVNHLYSMEKKQGPIVLKVRVPRNNPRMPSLTPLYRGAEYQEREAYDLFGIVYEGHPDLRRILMWDEFEGHPMRKDYVEEDQDVR